MIQSELLLTLFKDFVFIIFGIIGIGFLIGFHELGHFLFCKIFNISTPSFSIGMGPKIISKKIGETEFSLSLLPLGGYVEIAGAAEIGQGDQTQAHAIDSSSFAVKPYYQKLLVMLGGIAFNLMLAYIITIGLFLTNNLPLSTQLFHLNEKPTIDTINENSAAQKYGLQIGDHIKMVENFAINDNVLELLQHIKPRFNQPTLLTIERDKKIIKLPITPDINFDANANKYFGTLGVTFMPTTSNYTLQESISRGITLTNLYIKGIAKGLINIFREKNFDGLGGPISIISQVSKSAAHGFSLFFILLAIISINLALLNLIPLPIFDGGQILFYSIEALIGKPLSPTIKEYIHIATWLLVLFLMLVLSIRDISRIASPHIETIVHFLGFKK